MAEEQPIKSNFFVGDLVFAKMKSYPPWPAKVMDVSALASPGQQPKICVQFLGTNEIGYIRKNDLFDYGEFRDKFSIDKKIKGFREGLKIIAELYEEQQLRQKVADEKEEQEAVSNIFDDNACSSSKNDESSSEECQIATEESVDAGDKNSKTETTTTTSSGIPKVVKKRYRTSLLEMTATPTLNEKRQRKSRIFSDDFIITDPKLRHMQDQTMEDGSSSKSKKKKKTKKSEGRKSYAPRALKIAELDSTSLEENLESEPTGRVDSDLEDDTMPIISETPTVLDQNASATKTPKPCLKVKLLPSKNSSKRKLSSEDDEKSPSLLESTGKKAKFFPKIKLSFKPKIAQSPQNFEQVNDMPTLEMADESSQSQQEENDDHAEQEQQQEREEPGPDLTASPVIKLERYGEEKKPTRQTSHGFNYFLKLERAKKSSTLHVYDEKFEEKVKKEWSGLSENAKMEYEELAQNIEKPDQQEAINVVEVETQIEPSQKKNSPVKKEPKIKKEKTKEKKLKHEKTVAKMKPSLKVPKLSPVKKKTVPLSTSLPDDFQLILQPMGSSSSSSSKNRNDDGDDLAVIEVGPAEARYRWWLYQSSSTTGPQKKASRENSPPRTLTNDMLSDTTAIFRILSKTFQQMGNKLMQKSTMDAKTRSNQQAAMLDCLMDGFMVCMVQVLGTLRYSPVLSKCYPKEVMDDLMEKTSILTPL